MSSSETNANTNERDEAIERWSKTRAVAKPSEEIATHRESQTQNLRATIAQQFHKNQTWTLAKHKSRNETNDKRLNNEWQDNKITQKSENESVDKVMMMQMKKAEE